MLDIKNYISLITINSLTIANNISNSSSNILNILEEASNISNI